MYVDESQISDTSDVALQDKLFTESEIRTIIRKRILSEGGPRHVGKILGISPSYVSRASLGLKPIGPKLLELFGYEKISAYRLRETKP